MLSLWKVGRDWEGETCAVLAGGPGLTRTMAESLRGRCRVIAVNSCGVDTIDARGVAHPAMAPWADILYAADRLWWKHNAAAAQNFQGIRVTIQPNRCTDFTPLDGVRVLGNGGPQGFDDRKDTLRTGWNSGYQAVHLAAHLGVKRVLLLGFDMHSKHGEHWHGDHRWRPGYESRYPLFIRSFKAGAVEFARRRVEIINCTPGSALKCFPAATIEEGLSDAVQHVRKGAPHFAGAHASGSRGYREGASRGQATAAIAEEVNGASRCV
jgi:hypothetical protein